MAVTVLGLSAAIRGPVKQDAMRNGLRQTPGVEERWRDPDWLNSALSWVDEKLSETGSPRTGEPDQVHVRPWSTVIRVPTAQGPTWFKTNTEELKHEALVALLLAQRVPDRVPPLIAVDVERGWMLMEDGGVGCARCSPRSATCPAGTTSWTALAT